MIPLQGATPVAQLVRQCAPFVAPSTLSAIVRVESGGRPLAILDNATGRDYHPQSVQQGVQIINHLLSIGHRQLDVGIAQVDTENFTAYGLTPATALNACENIRVGAKILEAAYRQSAATYGQGQTALYHAFEAYNSGRLIGDPSYANKILAAAGVPVVVQGNGHLAYHHLRHFRNPFTVFWKTLKNAPYPVDTQYRGSGLAGTITWK
ncbi:MAG: lytic transglycosylase domain-containing protein [Acidithiobacillus sp.]|nr:lytic transglycosylase domain-containing protein [Acidithiobacillus sp.]